MKRIDLFVGKGIKDKRRTKANAVCGTSDNGPLAVLLHIHTRVGQEADGCAERKKKEEKKKKKRKNELKKNVETSKKKKKKKKKKNKKRGGLTFDKAKDDFEDLEGSDGHGGHEDPLGNSVEVLLKHGFKKKEKKIKR